MSNEFNITLDHITLVNETNELMINIPLDALWDSIIEYEFAYINAFLKISLKKENIKTTLLLTVHQEYLTANISILSRSVTLNANFEGVVDKDNPIVGVSTIICYNKQ